MFPCVLSSVMFEPLSGAPDNVSPMFLNKCCNNLAYPIAHILKLFCDNLFLPDAWRQACITPVFMKGDVTQVGLCNYRPISPEM